MKKNRIRLTESQLCSLIKKNVIGLLSEVAYREAPLYNEYGEVIDTGGWYDPEDYEDIYDEYEDSNANQRKAYGFIEKLNSGIYDNIVPQWASGERSVYDDLDLDIDLCGVDLQDAVNDRCFVIDKSSAFKYGQNPSDYPSTKKWSETNYPKDGNPNIKNRRTRNASDVLSDEYWEDKEMRDWGKKFPHTLTKKGRIRRNLGKLPSNHQKDLYGTDQADKRPLHRKGSLNRALDESIRRAIRKTLR